MERLLFNFKLSEYHALQKEIMEDKSPIKMIACGTKTGKTFGFMLEMARHGFNYNKPRQHMWWIAPYYEMADIAIDDVFKRRIYPYEDPQLKDKLNPGGKILKVTNQKPRKIHFYTTGSVISFESAKDPSMAKGRALNKARIDEIALCDAEILTNVLTMLTHTKGDLACFSTPKGKNWWYEEWLKGWDGDKYYPASSKRHKYKGIYRSWRAPTTANPTIDAAQIETWKRVMPEHIYQQEILAMWLDSGGDVYRNVNEICILNAAFHDRPETGHQYMIAWDTARKKSKSAFGVWDISVYPFEERVLDHFQPNKPWEECWEELAYLSKFWNDAPIIYDNTGGSFVDGHMEQFEKRNIRTIPFLFSGAHTGGGIKKNMVVHNLIMLCQTKGVRLLMHDDAKLEMESFTYTRTKHGNITYHPSSGMSDDFLDVRHMLGWEAVRENPDKVNMIVRESVEKPLTEAQILFNYRNDLLRKSTKESIGFITANAYIQGEEPETFVNLNEIPVIEEPF